MRDDGCAACKSASSARARTLLALEARVRVGPHAEEADTRGGACRQRRTPEEARAEKTGARKWGAPRDRICPHPQPHPHLQGKKRRVTATHDRRGGACRQLRTAEEARAEKTGTRREGAPRDRNCLHLHPHPHPEGLRRSVSATQDSRGGAGGEYGHLKAGRTAGQELPAPAPAPTPNPQGLRRRGWCRPHRRPWGRRGTGSRGAGRRLRDGPRPHGRLTRRRAADGRRFPEGEAVTIGSSPARMCGAPTHVSPRATRHATSSRPTRATRRALRDARRATRAG